MSQAFEIAKSVLQAEETARNIVKLLPKEEPTVPLLGIEADLKIVVTDTLTDIDCRTNPWDSCYLFNDGDDDIYYCVNRQNPVSDAEIKKGESAHVDLKDKLIYRLMIWCNTGKTASVRIKYVM